MTKRVIIPPIKSQGIKTKLIPWINDIIIRSGVDLAKTTWIEPFFGTGVVGLNTPIRGNKIVGDTNPHIISFYQAIQDGNITPQIMRQYLSEEGNALASADENGYAHYRYIKDRFNKEHNPLDFIFLSRAGFNGMMRFNKKGEWNIPFCKKPDRFATAYITKICNQVAEAKLVINCGSWTFLNQDFRETIKLAKEGDLIYCDPPYFGRYVDYYNGWTEEDEVSLFEALSNTPASFILSTWHHNDYRSNEMITRFWKKFNIETKDHFYHGGGHIENRHSIVEALVFNFKLASKVDKKKEKIYEPDLFNFV